MQTIAIAVIEWILGKVFALLQQDYLVWKAAHNAANVTVTNTQEVSDAVDAKYASDSDSVVIDKFLGQYSEPITPDTKPK